MRGCSAILDTTHVQQTPFQFDLFPSQIRCLRDTQAMSIGNQNQCSVAEPVASDTSGRTDQVADFILGQVLSAAEHRIRHAPRRWVRVWVGF